MKLKEIDKVLCLIIDPGSRTFDWLVARGMRMVQKKSHSINRGMIDIFQSIASGISKDIGTTYTDYDAIDLALRTNKNPIIYQKQYDITKYLPIAETMARQAVSTMMQWIEDSYSIQNVILVGGGAFLFKKVIKEAFPKHSINYVKDPLFANVRGFQLAGAKYAEKHEQK
jgi:plasmid segregation protein ParM